MKISKPLKITLFVVGAIAVIFTGILVYPMLFPKDDKPKDDTTPDDGTKPSQPTKPPTTSDSALITESKKFYIGYGQYNSADVVKVQKYLNKKYNAGLVEDGDFGILTLTALKKYENVAGVTTKNLGEINAYLQTH